jgi:cyclic pyranopterin monophosphate synthase
MTNTFTHFDEQGAAHMVDVSAKEETAREAVAEGRVFMQPETLTLVQDRKVGKGDVFAVARIAGIMAAKKTPGLVPLCHPLNLSSVNIDFDADAERSCVLIRATVRLTGRTGAEMEALAAVAVAGLTVYDMCKATDLTMTISDIRLMKKSGGKTGEFVRRDGPEERG